MGINVTFRVDNNTACANLKPPSGTVRHEDLSNDKIIIRDFKLNSCQIGALVVSAYLWQGVKNA